MKKISAKKYQILSTLARYVFVALFAFSVALPAFIASADCNGKPCPPDGANNNPAPTGVEVTNGIKNPLGDNITDIPSFITTILNFVLFIAVPIIALAIIYTGFLFVTAQGNSEKLKKAKTTLLYTIIGAALLLGSYVIAQAIKGTVDDIKSST